MAPVNLKSDKEDRILQALEAIAKGMSQRKAAVTFSLPRSTIYDRMKGRYRAGKSRGRDPFLSETEELSLVR